MATLNVLDYGAAGDGAQNDAPAIQSALDDAGNGDTVYLPATDASYQVNWEDSGIILVDRNRGHPDNLTIEGDGSGTVIKLNGSTANSGAFSNILKCRYTGGKSLTIRDLVIDGDRRSVSADIVGMHGILFRDKTFKDSQPETAVVEDVEIRNMPANGSGFGAAHGGVVFRDCTAHSNGQHGFGTDATVLMYPMPEVRRCHAYNNALSGFGKGIDLSSGTGRAVDCVVEGGLDGIKNSQDGVDFEWERIRVKNPSGHGYLTTSPGETYEVTMEDIVVEGSGAESIRLGHGTSFTLNGTFVANNCAQNGDQGADFHIAESATADGSSAHVYVNETNATNTYLRWASSGTGTIQTVSEANNGGTVLSNNGNLTVQNLDNQNVVDIDGVPTADEVGVGAQKDPVDTTSGSLQTSSGSIESFRGVLRTDL